jgi:hypothetical protein
MSPADSGRSEESHDARSAGLSRRRLPWQPVQRESAPASNGARAKGIIRIVDLVFIYKYEQRAATTLEIEDLPEEIKDAFAEAA